MAKAPYKSLTSTGNNLETIISLHSEINDLSTQLKTKKTEFSEKTDELKNDSKDIFDADLGAIGEDSVPEIYGNHGYPHGDHLITVNYKMSKGGLSFSNIAGRPACKVLPKLMGEKEYEKLFDEAKVLKETPEKLSVVHSFRPDLVGFQLTGELPEEALDDLRKKYPDAFTPYAKDEEKYITEIEGAEVETHVSTKTGFLEKAANLSDDTKYNLRDFIRKVLASRVTSAVKCGNKTDA